MKKNETCRYAHPCIRQVLQKAAASVLAFAVTVSAFTGLAPMQAHAADSIDCGSITNLIDQKTLQKGITVSGADVTSDGANYNWGKDDADWAAALTYNFTIPLDKILAAGTKASAIQANSTYDLGLPTQLCENATNDSVEVTANFKKAISFGGTSYTSYQIGTVTFDKTAKTAKLTFSGNDYANFLKSYTSSTTADYLPQCTFSFGSKLNKEAINTKHIAAIPLYFGGSSRQNSYFTLDLQFSEFVTQDPIMELSGQQITETQTVAVDKNTVSFTEVSTGEIEWKTVITPNNCTYLNLVMQMPLNGQTYVDGSFTYNGAAATSGSATVNGKTVSVAVNGDNFTATFAQELKIYANATTGKIILTYRTKPAAQSFSQPTYAKGQATKPGTGTVVGQVKLALGGGSVASSQEAPVDFSQTWLRKTGTYDAASNQIFWELIFNENGRALKGVTIHDALDANQKLISTQVYVSQKNTYNSSDASASGDKQVWKISNVKVNDDGSFDMNLDDSITASNKPLYISYSTTVKQSFFNQDNADTLSVYNDASVSFTMNESGASFTAGSFGPGPQSVKPGVSPLRKVGTYNAADHTISWQIYLNEAHSEWTYVSVGDVISSKDISQLLNGSDDTAKASGVKVEQYDESIGKWVDETSNQAKVSVTTSTDSQTKVVTSALKVLWANPDTMESDKLPGTDAPVQSIKNRKRITFTTTITDADSFNGNSTSSVQHQNTATLIVNPGPTTSAIQTSADSIQPTNSAPDTNGRLVIDQEYAPSVTVGTTTTPAVPWKYHYEKWNLGTKENEAASFTKNATGYVDVSSTMLKSVFTNVVTGSNYNYANHQLSLQLTVNQNKQPSMDGYYIVDTLPTNTKYVPGSLTCTDIDGNTIDIAGGGGSGNIVVNPDDPKYANFTFHNGVANNKTLVLSFKIEISDLAAVALNGNKTRRQFTLSNKASLRSGSDNEAAVDNTETTVQSPILEKKVLKEDTSQHWLQYQILINKTGADLTKISTAKIPITDTLPQGMQLVSGSVQIRKVAVTEDGASVDEAKSPESTATQMHAGTDYTYEVKSGSAATATPSHGKMTVNLTGDYLKTPCQLTYQVEINTLIPSAIYTNTAEFNNEQDTDSGVSVATAIQSVDEANSLATSDRGVIKIQKTDKGTGNPLENARFAVSCEDGTMPMLNGTEFAEVLTNNNGYAVFRVPLGHTYTVKELEAPSGYTKDAESIFSTTGAKLSLNTNDGGVVYQWDGKQFTSSADVKAFPVTNQRNNDSSITFYVQSNPATTGSTTSSSASSTGSAVSSAVSGTSSASSGSSSNSSSSQASSSSSTSSVSSSASSSKAAGAFFTGGIMLRGAGAITSPLPGTPLKGAVYGLYTNDSGDTPVKDDAGNAMTATSDSNGKLEFTKLAWGKTYYIQEITPPSLFKARKDTCKPYQADLTTESDVVFSGGDLVGKTNQLIINYDPEIGDGIVNVTKLGEDTGTVGLSGATFQLQTPGGAAFQTASTSDTGIATFKFLPAGTYKLHETKAPNNYLKAVDQDVTVTAGNITAVTVTDKRDPNSKSGSMTVQMKYDSTTDDTQVSKEYGFTVQLQNSDGTALNGTYNYKRSDGRTGTLKFGTGSSSSSSTSSTSSLHTATLSGNTAVVPMKGNTEVSIEVPNGTHYTVVAPEITGYAMKKSGDDAYVQASNTTPATFNYTKQAGTASSGSGTSGTSGASGTSKTSSAGSGVSGTSGASRSNASGTSGSTNNGNGTSGTNGTNGTSGTKGANGTNGTGGTTTGSGSKNGTLPKTSVPDTLPFWSVGLAASVIATFFVLRWGFKRKKREE